jgi:hypothetical protein
MATKKINRRIIDQWAELMRRIEEYRDAAIAESWKGGGDPVDVPAIDAQLQLAEALLNSHIEKMKRELT